MANHSFICNACVYYDLKTDKELNETKCENCNGQGKEWQPRNKKFYEKDQHEFMKNLLLVSHSSDRLENKYMTTDKFVQVMEILPEELADYVREANIGDLFFTNIYTERYMCYCTKEIINGSEEPCWLKMVER